jgi:hypothetical protein
MTKDDIAAVIKLIPTLTQCGVRLYMNGCGLTPEQQREKIAEEQKRLLASAEECTKICEWLQGMEESETFNNTHGSYKLKHLASHEIGYVTNGAFIAAAIHSGFSYKLIKDSLNVRFRISKKSVRLKEEAQERTRHSAVS